MRAALVRFLEGIVDRVSTEPRWTRQDRVPANVRTLAGVNITPDTAVTIATVWACLRYLSQTVAVLPWHVMKDGDKGPEIQDKNSIDWLLWKRPSPEWSSFQFRETLVHWALRWGNGYAEIEVDQLGRPFAMWPIHPERVEVCRAVEDGESDLGDPIRAGDLFYEVSQGTGPKVKIAARRMFHLRGFGEGPVGVNVIHYASQSLGWARAAQLFGATFFGNGLNPAGVVTFKKPLKSPAAMEAQRKEFDTLYQGPTKAHRTAFIDNEAEWKPITFNARDSQLIDVHQHLVEEICRWFGVPPHKVMHLLRSTFSNIEHQAIEVVVDSVTPWVKRFEDEADYKLFGPQNRQNLYTKMNMKALLRGDSAAQAQFFRAMFDMGVYSPNRILEALDENTIGEDGDKRLVQLNLTTLEKAGEEPEPVPAPAPAKAEPDGGNEEPAKDDPAVEARLVALERSEPVDA